LGCKREFASQVLFFSLLKICFHISNMRSFGAAEGGPLGPPEAALKK